MEIIQLDLGRTCRTCKAQVDNMVSVFERSGSAEEYPRIDEMLMACTAVQVTQGDGLPSVICPQCLDKLRSAFTFKKQCKDVDSSLREYLKGVDFLYIKHELQKELEIKEETHTDNSISDSVESTSVRTEETAKEPDQSSTEQCDFILLLDNNQMVLTCRECGKVFTTLEGIRSHKRIHLGTLFKCKYCGKGYTRQTHVLRHEMSHGPHKLHICRICNKTLTRIEHLKRHLTTHLKEKPFSCKLCNRGFNRSDHLEVHAARCKGERVHICDICNRGFNREDSLEVHKKLHENQRPILPTLDNIDNIEEHYYEIDHDPNVDFSPNSETADDFLEPEIEVTEDDKTGEQDDTEEKKIDLDIDQSEIILDRTNNTTADLSTIEPNEDNNENDTSLNDDVEIPADNEIGMDDGHDDSDSVHSEYLPTKSPKKRGRGRPRKNPLAPKWQAVVKSGRPRGRPPAIKKDDSDDETGEFACSICSESFTKKRQMDKHMKKHENQKPSYACKVCSKEFTRFNHLKRHMTSHSIVKPFSCEVCGKKFARRDHLQQHSRLHERKPDHECDICQKMFTRADQLAKHKASKHNLGEKVLGEKKFECPVCQKSFTTEKYRDVHVKGHSGEKRFKCKTCEKCFLSKSHLTEHMKFHNEHSKKFLCSECGQRFIRNDYLVIHMRRHRGEKPFKCKFCGKGFPRTTDLTVHERYHTGEKTHLCTICGRGFGRAYNLTVHMRTHTGEKPYQCTYCEAAFAQGNDLKAHVRRHTGERFQCELCTESFLMGYLLTQHKRTVHGLNVVSNIRRLQPINKIKQDIDEPPPITIPLPKPVIPEMVLLPHLPSQVHQQMMRE